MAIFNWSVVDLQCCVNFCCVAEWFRFTYMYVIIWNIYIYTHILLVFFSIMVYHSILNIVLFCYTAGPHCLHYVAFWYFFHSAWFPGDSSRSMCASILCFFSLLSNIVVWMCHSLYSYSPTEGHLAYLQFLAIMNKVVIHLQVFTWT